MLGLGKFGERMGNGMAIVESLVKQMKEGSILKLSRIFNLRIKKPSQTRGKKKSRTCSNFRRLMGQALQHTPQLDTDLQGSAN